MRVLTSGILKSWYTTRMSREGWSSWRWNMPFLYPCRQLWRRRVLPAHRMFGTATPDLAYGSFMPGYGPITRMVFSTLQILWFTSTNPESSNSVECECEEGISPHTHTVAQTGASHSHCCSHSSFVLLLTLS